MNYHELQYILCIAKHQNLTKAAQELYISQPTLTKHLQKLEREMGTKLFSRSGNSYTPTFAGRKYMEYARKILQIRQDWEKELKDLTENNEGELNVAFPLMRSTCMVPQIMTSFFQKYPKVKVNILEEAYSIQEKLLLNDQLDFGIFNEVHEHPKLEYELLKKEEILLIMPPDHPLASAENSRPSTKVNGRKHVFHSFYPAFSGTDHRTAFTGSFESCPYQTLRTHPEPQHRNLCQALHAGTWYVLHSRNLCPKYGPPCKTSLLFRW